MKLVLLTLAGLLGIAISTAVLTPASAVANTAPYSVNDGGGGAGNGGNG